MAAATARTLVIILSMAGLLLAVPRGGAPYPPSRHIAGITWEWQSFKRQARGSDNWAITWADDDHQYAAWGDGGGFGGTNSDGRVSLGVARIEGGPNEYIGRNVWGGKNPEAKAAFGGKSYGIISIDGVLYMWVAPGSGAKNLQRQTLHRSTDRGRSWEAADWSFVRAAGVILPTFVQFGRDYEGARDDYVYIHAARLEGTSNRARKIDLMRVPKAQLMNRDAYRFFAGLDDGGKPVWTDAATSRQPVFVDPAGVGPTVSVSYNAGLRRYLLCTGHRPGDGAGAGRGIFDTNSSLGIFDAPEPWGPWTTVEYYSNWGKPTVTGSCFFWNFSNKWTGSDGTRTMCVFTGTGEADAWNSVAARFEVHPDAARSRPSEE